MTFLVIFPYTFSQIKPLEVVTWKTQGYSDETGTEPDDYVEWFDIPLSRENAKVYTWSSYECVVLSSAYCSCSLVQAYDEKIIKVRDFNFR
jgi:hypothetical protein